MNYKLIKNTDWKELEINDEKEKIPYNWNIDKICNLVKTGVTKGTTPSTIGFDFLESGIIKFFKIEHLKNDILLDSNTFISEECNKKMKRSELMENDLLFSIAGTIGNIAKVEKKHLPANTNQAVAIVRLKNKEDIDFVKLYFKNYIKKLTKNALTGVISNFNLGMLENLEIRVPPIQEKLIISSILLKQELIISNIKKLIEKNEIIFNELTNKLLSGEFRLKNDNGKISIYKNNQNNWKSIEVNGKFKKIPKDWDVYLLKDKVKIHSGGTPAKKEGYYGGDIPWITTTDLNYSYIHKTGKSITELGLKNSAAKIVEKNTILFAMYGASIGKMGISYMKAATNQSVACIIANKDVHFKYLYLRLFSVKNKIANLGIGNGQPNISQEVLKEYSLIFPNYNEQLLIVNILGKNEKLIEKQKSLLIMEKQKFEWLLDNLLSGNYLVEEIQ